MFNNNISESSALSKKVLRWCWAGFFSIVFQSSYAVTIDPDAEFYSGGQLQGVDTSNLPNMKVPDQRDNRVGEWVAVRGGIFIGYNDTDNTILVTADNGMSGVLGNEDEPCDSNGNCRDTQGYVGCWLTSFVTNKNVSKRDFDYNNYEFSAYSKDANPTSFFVYNPNKVGNEINMNCHLTFVVPGHKAYMVKTLRHHNNIFEDKSQDFFKVNTPACHNYLHGDGIISFKSSTDGGRWLAGCIDEKIPQFNSHIYISASRLY